MAAMTAQAALCPVPVCEHRGIQRVADLQLRSRTGPLHAQVAWPAEEDLPPALLIFFSDAERDATSLCRALCAHAGVVVLAVAPRSVPADPASTAFDDATTVLGWAADHAAELDADPARLVVAGQGAGAALAAATALHARDEWWPAIGCQLLIHPQLDAWQASVPYASSLRTAPLAGAPPATVVWGSPFGDSGRDFAARLRSARVEVEEVHDSGIAPASLGSTLAQALRRI